MMVLLLKNYHKSIKSSTTEEINKKFVEDLGLLSLEIQQLGKDFTTELAIGMVDEFSTNKEIELDTIALAVACLG